MITFSRLSNVIALVFLVGVPLVFATESATQAIFRHPLGLFLLTPLCILAANMLYTAKPLPKSLVVLEGLFFILWASVCLSVFAASVSTENGPGTLFGSFFHMLGTPYPEAERLGFYAFVLAFLFSLCFAGIAVLYASILQYVAKRKVVSSRD